MSILKFKNADGTWNGIAAFKGENGKDGAIQYKAGAGIKIENDTITAEVTKQYVDTALAELTNMGFTPEVVESLPTENIKINIIYMLPAQTSEAENIYEEWMYINNKWEMIGSTSVDLSNYYTKDETNAKLDTKQNKLTSGENITIDENNVISVSGVNTPEFFIDIPSVSVSTSNRYKTYTLSDNFNSQLTTIINNIFGKYQRFTVMFLVNFVLAKFKPSVMSYSDGRGTLTLGGHPSQINLYAVINTNTAISTSGVEPVTFGGYIPLTLTIYLSWDGDIALVTKSTFRMHGYSGVIPSIDYMIGKTLFKDNTTSYIPTGDYNPATKKYVDDSKVTKSGVLEYLEEENIYILTLDNNINNGASDISNGINGTKNEEICGYFAEILNKVFPKKSGTLILNIINTGYSNNFLNNGVFRWDYGSRKFYTIGIDSFGCRINYLDITFNSNTDGTYNVTRVKLAYNPIKSSYTPTDNNHVVNKKYVDDAVAAASVGGITEELDPTVPVWVKSITENDILNWNNKADSSTISGVVEGILSNKGYITEETEPAFNASVAANITQNDIDSWNAKQNAISISDKYNGTSNPVATIADIPTDYITQVNASDVGKDNYIKLNSNSNNLTLNNPYTQLKNMLVSNGTIDYKKLLANFDLYTTSTGYYNDKPYTNHSVLLGDVYMIDHAEEAIFDSGTWLGLTIAGTNGLYDTVITFKPYFTKPDLFADHYEIRRIEYFLFVNTTNILSGIEGNYALRSYTTTMEFSRYTG